MTTSNLALQSYIDALKEYLQQKGIIDFTKFEVSLHKDKLKYIKWDYPNNIEKPKDIIPNPIPIKVLTESPKIYDFDYIFVIGGSNKESQKTNIFDMLFLFPLSLEKISIQITHFQNMGKKSGHPLHEDLISTISTMVLWNNNKALTIEVDTFSISKKVWTHDHLVFIRVSIHEENIPVIRPVRSH